jgi:hypothetical protein
MMNTHADNGLDWCPEFNPQQAIFNDLRALFSSDFDLSWPQIANLNALLPAGTQTVSAHEISFVSQTGKMTALEYEQQIWFSGRVPTRVGAWHDLFNALMWSLFPRGKARLNALHLSCEQTGAGGSRSRLRDALTLIDECGIIIASCDPRARQANAEHDWQQLFVAKRDRWFGNYQPLIIGHGLYQQCLSPYLGLTAKAIYLTVEPGFFKLALVDQYRLIDGLLDRELLQLGQTLTPVELLAFPILGVPGWHPDNQDPKFYDHKGYFRSRKQ